MSRVYNAVASNGTLKLHLSNSFRKCDFILPDDNFQNKHRSHLYPFKYSLVAIKPFSPISRQTWSNSLHKVAHTRPITLTKASISPQSSPFSTLFPPHTFPFSLALLSPPFHPSRLPSHARSLAQTYISVANRSRRLMNLEVEAQKLPIPRLIPFSVVARFSGSG